MKKFNEFINEGIKSKTIITPKEFTIDNLKTKYPDLNIRVADFNVIISSKSLRLNNEFYQALENDHINKDDIAFENCEEIELYDIDGFTKVSDYGVFGSDIKDFYCSHCDNITSLEGSPEMISGDFYCSGCTNLTSLDGAPKEVGGYFGCSECENLTSLDGAPKKVSCDFSCSGCDNLTSLDGAPETVGGNFWCEDCNPDFIDLAKEKYGDKVHI